MATLVFISPYHRKHNNREVNLKNKYTNEIWLTQKLLQRHTVFLGIIENGGITSEKEL